MLRIPVILVWLACGLPLAGQSWDAVQALRPGDRVKVLDNMGQERAGVLAAASAAAISIKHGKSDIAIDRARVRRVWIRSGSLRARHALIGAAIGVVMGVVVDRTLGAHLRNESGEDNRALSYIAPIAIFGGIAGAFPAYRTVYRVR